MSVAVFIYDFVHFCVITQPVFQPKTRKKGKKNRSVKYFSIFAFRFFPIEEEIVAGHLSDKR